MGSKEDFFGGYDHAKRAGVVHIADHHIAPGKKQWTWGNHEFGYAWDRNLTDEDGPYIELMAGVFTDNQPDFSFLMPGETKTWSQYWYPIREIGPAQHANLDAAVSLRWRGLPARGAKRGQDARVTFGVSVSREFLGAEISLIAKGKVLKRFARDLLPGAPFVESVALSRGVKETDLRIVVSHGGHAIISYQPKPRVKGDVPPPATEPSALADITSADELFITGLHLDQYRHATRCPTLYWREALCRDPMDSRCNNAMGLWHLKRGEFEIAEKYFRAAIERLTRRNPNPADGEAYYNLGLCLRFLGRDDEAYDAFYKATWNHAWQAAGFHSLAEIDCCRGDFTRALDLLERSLKKNADNLRARNLKAMVLRKLGRVDDAAGLLRETLSTDPLDWWARWPASPFACDAQTRIDLAIDFARAGFFADAIDLLKSAPPDRGIAPLVGYYRGWLYEKIGDAKSARLHFKKAAALSPDYCFPSRLEDIAVLKAAIRANPRDARAPFYLGNLLYDKRRHDEAIKLWAKSAGLDGSYSVVWRNLGIGYFNIRKQPKLARAFYDKALRVNPGDARLLFERDQLWKRLGIAPAKRLSELEKRRDLVARRDDLSVEICALWNQTGQHTKALELLSSRKFQPWEGGEGAALGQFKRTQLALGRAALAGRDARATFHFQQALEAPENLGEAWHLLQNQSDTHYWLGVALDACGDSLGAKNHWRIAAEFRGDFQEMSVRGFSEMTYYSALSLERLGRKAEAKKLLRDLERYARELEKTPAKIDYFATSLPTMLIFDDDLQARQTTAAKLMQALALLGLRKESHARRILTDVLRRDPSHPLAADLNIEKKARLL
jgi:tetratricopeptide (TPR) repeat protein